MAGAVELRPRELQQMMVRADEPALDDASIYTALKALPSAGARRPCVQAEFLDAGNTATCRGAREMVHHKLRHAYGLYNVNSNLPVRHTVQL